MNETQVEAGLAEAYSNFYQQHDESWRMLGAKYKAQNIVDVCHGHTFLKVLEVGAGDGSILHYLDQWNFAPEIHALEIAESGVDLILKKNLKNLVSAKVFDGYHIPFEDNSFDLVILSHVLEHVEYERTLLRELKRVSKFQVIEVPKDYRFGVDKRMKHFLDYGHINVYTPSSLRFLLQSEGLEPVNDKISMTEPSVTKFNTFINRKAPKSFFKSLKIDVEYLVKKVVGKAVGRRKQEEFANSYTILTKKTTDIHIF